jgi:seryl-tRNA synthetase
VQEEKARSNEIKAKIDEAEKQKDDLTNARNKKLNTVGNIVHESVPISKDEANNAIYSTWG